MNKLSDNKLSKLKSLDSQGGFWYITKQNLIFRDLCFMAKILETWNDRKEENYQSFFDRHKILPEYGALTSDLAHRATKNCEYLGLTVPSEKYSSQNLTPFYFALSKMCEGDFNKLSSYPQIVNKQLERMYIDSQTNRLYSVNFKICPFMFLFKILLLLGDITKSFKISKAEFKLFVATAQTWSEYFEVVESILRYRNDTAYRAECDKNISKVSDSRYQVLAQNHSQLEVDGNNISIKDDEIKNVRRKVAEYELSEKVQSAEDIYSAESIFTEPNQIIYFGAPGTGKSFRVEQITEQYGDDVIRTTFHPDSDYSTFVGCYKPSMESIPQTYTVEGKEKPIIGKDGEQVTKEEIVYSFVPQAFTQAYTRAWLNPDKQIFLVIEELNRGNCAQIFGDIFQLLDRNENNESAYSIIPDHDLQQHLATEFKNAENIPSDIKEAKAMRLPANLYIWATMNTSDQSLFPIDSAFKRRWIWKYIPIADAGKDYKIKVGDHQYDWWTFVEKVNGEIEQATKSEDKKLGYFFAKADNNIIAADTFVSKVVFYLWNDVFKDSYDKTIFKNDLTFHKFFLPNGDPKIEVIDQFMHDLDLKADGEE